MKKVTFYTTGEELTVLIRDFISSGEFEKAIAILEEGGLSKEYIAMFLMGELKFTGNSRSEEGIIAISCSQEGTDLIDGWITHCHEYCRDIWDIDHIPRPNSKNKNTPELFRIIPRKKFKELYRYDILKRRGYRIYTSPPAEKIDSGVILRNGHFVECGYQGHVFLYPVLHSLDLAENDSWTDEETLLHISSQSYSGKVAYSIPRDVYDDLLSPEQVQAIFDYRDHFNSFYSEGRGSVIDALRRRVVRESALGSKYGNLMFLKRFYAFKTPEISPNPFKGSYCLRTSPNTSMPGVLESMFNVTSETHAEKVLEIRKTWHQAEANFPELVRRNKLNIFCQEFIEGVNGVCHYREKGDFTYQLGEQFEVVKGQLKSQKEKYVDLLDTIHGELRDIARQLHKDLGKQIQLEFVITPEKEVYIVQLRYINTPVFTSNHLKEKYEVVGKGISFTSGYQQLKKSECLIVQNEVESNDVKDYKAIIVRDHVEFSHALALSQSLRIPSLYGIGDLGIPDSFIIDTTYKTGVIYRDLD